MRVLIADAFCDDAVASLKSTGLEVSVDPGLREDALQRKMQDFQPQVLVVTDTRVEASHLASPGLALVARAGSGVDTIDVAAAAKLGIFVTHCPGVDSAALAEMAWTLILGADRRLGEATMDLRAGKWNRKELRDAHGLRGRTLGLVGIGPVGKRMIPVAKAFGMEVMAYSRALSAEEVTELGAEPATMVELALNADVISVHMSLTEHTRGLLGREFFDAVRPDTVFVNVSRAEVVDRKAMNSAAKAKNLRLGLDVFHGQPHGDSGNVDEPLADIYGSVFGHHMGALTRQAWEATTAKVVENIATFYRSGQAPGAVNLEQDTSYSQLLVVRIKNESGVLSAILNEIKNQGFNVLHMQNHSFQGENAAIARIAFSGYGDLKEEPILAAHSAVLDARIARGNKDR